MRTLIDTNAYSALMKGAQAVADFLDTAETVYLSAIVAGELITGFRGGRQEQRNRRVLGDFIKTGGKTVVLPVTLETAQHFARIKDALKKRGTPLPLNDIWIAAQCFETGAVLLTLDSHFRQVEGLFIWDQLLSLPEQLERQLTVELEEETGGKTMSYVTSWERIARKDAKLEGMIEERREVLARQLDRKFGLSPEEKGRIACAGDPEKLDRALDAVLFADTKEAVLRELD